MVMMVVVAAAIIAMRVLVAMLMLMAVIMCMGFGLRISAAFGVESSFDQSHFGAQPAHHIFDHMIAADADFRLENLHRQVAITQMPSDMGELQRIAHANFCKRFRLAEHFNKATIIEHDRIARAQHDGVRQIEQKFQPAHASHGRAASMAFGGIEQHSIGACIGTCGLCENFSGADHL
jgi:hypothetical protein